MELANEHKNSHSLEGEKSSVADKTNKETPVKIVVDDVELNEEQLDIISGGGNPLPDLVGGKP